MAENRITIYFKESFEELTKVTWPTKKQAVHMTILVLVFCLVMAVILGALDYLFTELYTLLLKAAL